MRCGASVDEASDALLLGPPCPPFEPVFLRQLSGVMGFMISSRLTNASPGFTGREGS